MIFTEMDILTEKIIKEFKRLRYKEWKQEGKDYIITIQGKSSKDK
jgi:hypothetical protein